MLEILKIKVKIKIKLSGYIKTFKDNKLISSAINDDKLLKKYKSVWTKIGDLWNDELITFTVHNDRYT